MNELTELMTDAVANQDFTGAATIKDKIATLEVSKQALLDDMKPKMDVIPSQVNWGVRANFCCFYTNQQSLLIGWILAKRRQLHKIKVPDCLRRVDEID